MQKKKARETQTTGEMPELRQRAEEMAGERLEAVQALSAEDAPRLVHELRVHQIELEMQNEELRQAQEALSASRDRYIDLYDFAPVGYLTVGEKGLIEAANLTAAALLGIDRRALMGRPLSRFMDQADAYYHHLRQVIETGVRQICEIRMMRPDGLSFDAGLESVLVKGAEGRDAQFRIAITDMTRRKQAEAALSRQIKMQRALLGINTAVQAMIQPSDLELVMQICLEVVQQLGMKAQTMAIHRMLNEAEKTFDTVRVGAQGTISAIVRTGMSHLTECWRSGQIVLRQDIENGAPQEVASFRGKFGGVPIRSYLDCPFSRGVLSVHSVHPNAFSQADEALLGQVGEILSLGISRMEDLERIAASQNALAAIVTSSEDAITAVNQDWLFTDWNAAAERIFGYRAEEILGRPVSGLLPPDRQDEAQQLYERVAQGHRVVNYETARVRKDGQAIQVSMTLSPVRNADGTISRISAITRDITEKKHAEQQMLVYQEQLRLLAAQLSLVEQQERRQLATDLHDRIGQTLATALLKLDATQAQALSHEIGDTFNEVRNLINQTYQDTRSLVFEISPPALHEQGLTVALQQLADEISRQRGLWVDITDDGQSKPLVEEFGDFLFRAVRELLINAAKHAQADRAEVTLLRAGDNIRIEVADVGAGFDVSALEVGTNGAGKFGLFSIQERLDFLGGSFEIESEPGRGTQVTMELPLERGG